MKINNIVRSKKATANNPDRCWMNIRLERMGMFLNTDYVFECIIDGVKYIYNGSVSELLNAFKAYEVDVMKNPDRYSFYLDYREGKIYKKASANDRDVVFSLQKIEDVTLREIEGKQEMKPVESCQWEKLLRTVGISTFVKYYFVFKFYSTDKCVQAFVEDYTLDSKRAKASAARAIFRNGSHIEVLKYIRDAAGKIPDEQKANASWYLRLEE